MTLSDTLQSQFYQRIQSRVEKLTESPSSWIEKYFYVPDPRDPVSGDFLPIGPLRLTDFQKRIIDEALSRRPDGKFKYSTILYSAPKKSGKSAVAAAVTLYMAFSRPNSFVYCLANDGTQSTDRIYEPIRRCLELHRDTSGPFAKENPLNTEVLLSNHTKIRAIPCDAKGEAGSQPLMTTFSEVWGYDNDAKRRLWTEMTIPPTLNGYAVQWVESYAGYVGKSDLLEQLYRVGVLEASPHPDFMDLTSDRSGHSSKATVFVNDVAGMFTYWDHEHRMVWQTPDYYGKEAKRHTPAEFDRIHNNVWTHAVGSFIQPEQWGALSKDLGPIRNLQTPVVMAVDVGISNDYASIVGVTRDPDNDDHIAARFCYILTPQQAGGRINPDDVGKQIEQYCKLYNVVCCAYDKYQMESVARDLRKRGIVWMYDFSQQSERSIADKELYDRILQRTLSWDMSGDGIPLRGDLPSLTQQILWAGKENTKDHKVRLQKLSDKNKIDAVVALSMAVYRAATLNISNRERQSEDIYKQLARGSITETEFLRLLRHRNHVS